MRIMLIMSIFLEIKLFLIFLILKTDSMIESALIKNTPDFGGHFFPYIYKMFGSASIVTKARVNIEFIHSASVLARGIALSDRESLGKPKLMTYSTFTLYWFLVSLVKPLFASLTTRWNSILNIQNYHEDCLYHKHHEDCRVYGGWLHVLLKYVYRSKWILRYWWLTTPSSNSHILEIILVKRKEKGLVYSKWTFNILIG